MARELVLALSRYVNILLQTGNLVNTYGLIVQAYECMIRWVLVSQWIIGDKDCCKAVIETLSKGITILEKDTHTVAPPNTSEQPPIVPPEKKKRRDTGLMPPKQLFQLPPRVNKGAHQTTSPNSNTSQHESSHALPTDTSRPAKEYIAIRRAAQYCMSLFVNQLGRFALPNELDDARPEMADDLHQLRLYKEKHGTYERCPIRCFMLGDRTLLTIMDTTSHIPSILVVVRDTTGKYAWSIETRYMDKPIEPPNQSNPPKQEQQRQHQTVQPTLSINKRVVVPKATAVNEAEMPSMEKLFAPHSDNWKELETVKVLIDRQLKAETTQKKPVATVCRTLPACTKVDYELPRGFRLFLSQLGFLLPQNREHIIPLKMNDAVVSEMEALDMLSE